MGRGINKATLAPSASLPRWRVPLVRAQPIHTAWRTQRGPIQALRSPCPGMYASLQLDDKWLEPADATRLRNHIPAAMRKPCMGRWAYVQIEAYTVGPMALSKHVPPNWGAGERKEGASVSLKAPRTPGADRSDSQIQLEVARGRRPVVGRDAKTDII